MPLLAGRLLCEVAYTNALPPFKKKKKSFTPINGGKEGAWVFVSLSYASDSGAARICQGGGGGGQSEGAK